MDKKTYDHLIQRVRKRNMNLRDGEPFETNEPEIPAPSDQELKAMASAELKHSITTGIQNIDMYNIGPDADPTTSGVLNGYRAELVGLKDLPGSADAVNTEAKRIIDAINNILDFSFRFETI